MAILEMLGCYLLNNLIENAKSGYYDDDDYDDYDDYQPRNRGMSTYRVYYWDYKGNYVAADVCAGSAGVAMNNVRSRCDCKTLGSWEEL